jgi:hypothetical protein
MRYIVILNLDYENYEQGRPRELFADISQALQDKGYVVDGRRFTIDANPAEAQQLAREAVDSVEQRHNAGGESIYVYIKEFFGFEVEHAVNLLLPPDEEIEVSELEDVDGIALTDFLKS